MLSFDFNIIACCLRSHVSFEFCCLGIIQDMEVIIPDPARVPSSSGVVESKSMVNSSSLQKQDSHRGLLVDRGVGSPRLVKSPSTSTFTLDTKPDSDTKVCSYLIKNSNE